MSKLSGLAKTAYQSDTPKKYLIDAATLYKNLTFDATTQLFSGELIGATNGGIEIDLEQKYRDVEVDGTYWTTVKGNKVLSSTSASAKTSIKEFTAETLRLSINGEAKLVTDPNEAPTGYSVVTGKRYVEDADYIDNVGMVGKLSGTNKPIIVIFDKRSRDSRGENQNRRRQGSRNSRRIAGTCKLRPTCQRRVPVPNLFPYNGRHFGRFN